MCIRDSYCWSDARPAHPLSPDVLWGWSCVCWRSHLFSSTENIWGCWTQDQRRQAQKLRSYVCSQSQRSICYLCIQCLWTTRESFPRNWKRFFKPTRIINPEHWRRESHTGLSSMLYPRSKTLVVCVFLQVSLHIVKLRMRTSKRLTFHVRSLWKVSRNCS